METLKVVEIQDKPTITNGDDEEDTSVEPARMESPAIKAAAAAAAAAAYSSQERAKNKRLRFLPQEDPINKLNSTSLLLPLVVIPTTVEDPNRMAAAAYVLPDTVTTAQGVSAALLVEEKSVSTRTGGTAASKQFELISGLWVTLSANAEICRLEDGSLSVRAETASLGDSSNSFLITAKGLLLQARLVGSEVHNLVVSLEGGMTLDPFVTREKVQNFLHAFGLPKIIVKDGDHGKETSIPTTTTTTTTTTRKSRMSRKEWEQFLCSVQTNTTTTTPNDNNNNNDSPVLIPLESIQTADAHGLFQKLDLKIPNVEVKAVQFHLPSYNNNATMNFLDCQGSQCATLRTLLEYYIRSVLDQMDLWSGTKADVSLSAVASDVASVKASMVGGSVGIVLLGPMGFVAGSYLGNRWMRQSSSAVTGGTAGLALFGPVGLVAGAVATTEGQGVVAVHPAAARRPQPKKSTTIDDSGRVQRKSVVKTTSDAVAADKYEYAGSTGVLAGAALGLAIAGPIGLVAGSVAGSMGGRKLVEATSTSMARNSESSKTTISQNIGDKRQPYRFGDFTRGVVARGKESRSADEKEGYRFGDFARGLFS